MRHTYETGPFRASTGQEAGVVFVAMLVLIVPLVVTAGFFTSTMTSRTERLMGEIDRERALMAAESGVDLGLWLGQVGFLSDGMEFTYTLGPGSWFELQSTHLRSDGVDNDEDGGVDEADEDVYQIIVTGHYRNTSRRIASYLGPVPVLPLSFGGAMSIHNPDVEIRLAGTPQLSGFDTDIDGDRGDPDEDVAGISIASPGTPFDVLSELSPKEQTLVVGAGGIPSIAAGEATDIDTIVAAARNSADVVLTSDRYSSMEFGDGAAGTAHITFREGDVSFGGNTTGAGLLVVTGDLDLSGNFRFDGVVVVLGNLTAGKGTALIRGAVVQGREGELIEGVGTFDVRYSSEALALASSVSGRYVAFNGWQEVSR